MAEQVLKVISGCYSTHFMVLRYIVNFSRRSLILWVLEKILLSISYFFVKNYGSRSKKGEILRFELNHNALNRKPRK